MASKRSPIGVLLATAAVAAIGVVPILIWLFRQGQVEPLGGTTYELDACKKFDPSQVSATVRVVLPLDGNPIGAARIVLQRDHMAGAEDIDDSKLLDEVSAGVAPSFGTPNQPATGSAKGPFHVFLDGLSASQYSKPWAQIRVIVTDTSKYVFTRKLDNKSLNGVGFSSGSKKFICTPTGVMPLPIPIVGPTSKLNGEVAVFYARIGGAPHGNSNENGFNIVYEAPNSDTPVIVDPKIKNNG